MRVTALNGNGMAVEGQVWVEARANVLGLGYGERAFLPVDFPELSECLMLGFVVRVADDGTVPDPLPVPVHRGCGGCGGR